MPVPQASAPTAPWRRPALPRWIAARPARVAAVAGGLIVLLALVVFDRPGAGPDPYAVALRRLRALPARLDATNPATLRASIRQMRAVLSEPEAARFDVEIALLIASCASQESAGYRRLHGLDVSGVHAEARRLRDERARAVARP